MKTLINSKLLPTSLIVIASLLVAVAAQAGHHGDNKKSDMAEHKAMYTKDIVDTAVAAGSFETLAAALTEADLIDTLKGDGPFTVFAPTDEAFAKLPADQLKAILADKALLTSILTYHVVAGKVSAAEVVKLDSATTLQGSEVAVSTSDGVSINDAKVIKADIKTSNGIIHVIDTVLVPQA